MAKQTAAAAAHPESEARATLGGSMGVGVWGMEAWLAHPFQRPGWSILTVAAGVSMVPAPCPAEYTSFVVFFF